MRIINVIRISCKNLINGLLLINTIALAGCNHQKILIPKNHNYDKVKTVNSISTTSKKFPLKHNTRYDIPVINPINKEKVITDLSPPNYLDHTESDNLDPKIIIN